MPRDYAKSTRRTGKNKAVNESMPGWIWLFTGIFLGLFIGGLAYLNKHSVSNTNKPLITAKEAQKSAPGADVKANQVQPAPKFDFYTMLPQNQTPKEAVEEQPSPSQQLSAEQNESKENPEIAPSNPPAAVEPNQIVAPKTAIAPVNTNKVINSKITSTNPVINKAAVKTKENYILTIAALKNYQDADKLKAQLSLLGFDVHIKAIKVNDVTLQRVWLGPYNSFTEAQKDQQRLSENHFKSLLVKQASVN